MTGSYLPTPDSPLTQGKDNALAFPLNWTPSPRATTQDVCSLFTTLYEKRNTYRKCIVTRSLGTTICGNVVSFQNLDTRWSCYLILPYLIILVIKYRIFILTTETYKISAIFTTVILDKFQEIAAIVKIKSGIRECFLV